MQDSVGRRIKVAFIKFGGLSAGGTERWLQMMAAALPPDRFEVTYFYTDAAPYIGSALRHPGTDPHRQAFMEARGVRLIKVKVGAKDVTVRTHDWRDTDLWELFDPEAFDIVQAGKAGHVEFPFYRLPMPVVEYVTLGGVDLSPNVACSIHITEWQRRRWIEHGGSRERSAVIPIPAAAPATSADLRAELGIPSDALVAGFHQRANDEISSPIPLAAFARAARTERYFIVMGGGESYRRQAAELGTLNVRFLPHSADERRISAFLNTLDIFAHGRRDGETFGTVFAEAMRHRKPCISHVSAVANGHVEAIGPGGFVCVDPTSYAGLLTTLFENAALRHKLGAAGLAHANAHYDLGACVARLVDIYEDVFAQGRERFAIPIAADRLRSGLAGFAGRHHAARRLAAAALPRPLVRTIRRAIRY
jgi:hypothetical protein